MFLFNHIPVFLKCGKLFFGFHGVSSDPAAYWDALKGLPNATFSDALAVVWTPYMYFEGWVLDHKAICAHV